MVVSDNRKYVQNLDLIMLLNIFDKKVYTLKIYLFTVSTLKKIAFLVIRQNLVLGQYLERIA
jgi:hypothetical protein